jgi:hypothetical protein
VFTAWRRNFLPRLGLPPALVILDSVEVEYVDTRVSTAEEASAMLAAISKPIMNGLLFW